MTDASGSDDAGARDDAAAAPGLRWGGPPGCGSAAEVRRRLEALAGAPTPDVRADAVVRREQDGYALTVAFPDRPGAAPRELRAATCAALVDAAAVVLSLAARDAPAAPRGRPADASAPADPRDGVVPPEGGVPGGGEVPPGRDPDPTEAPGPADRALPRLSARVAARGDLGSLPLAAAGVAIGLDLGGARWSVGAEARWLGPATATYQDPADAGATLSLATGAVEGCAWLPVTSAEVAPCAVVELGAVFGRGFGVDEPGRGSNAWIAVGLAGRLDVALTPRLGLDVRLEALAPLHRPRFEVSPYGSLFRAAPVVGRVGIGLRWGRTGAGR